MLLLKDRMPDPGKRKGPPAPEIKRKRENGTERNPSLDSGDLSDDRPSGEERRIVTNTDEQNYITNVGQDPIDEKEREGV